MGLWLERERVAGLRPGGCEVKARWMSRSRVGMAANVGSSGSPRRCPEASGSAPGVPRNHPKHEAGRAASTLPATNARRLPDARRIGRVRPSNRPARARRIDPLTSVETTGTSVDTTRAHPPKRPRTSVDMTRARPLEVLLAPSERPRSAGREDSRARAEMSAAAPTPRQRITAPSAGNRRSAAARSLGQFRASPGRFSLPRPELEFRRRPPAVPYAPFRGPMRGPLNEPSTNPCPSRSPAASP